MKKVVFLLCAVLIVPFIVSVAWATPVVYTVEGSFLTDLALLGTVSAESFEDETVWNGTDQVDNPGITWKASSSFATATVYNHDLARGVYDSDLVSADFIVSSSSTPLVGFGGWFRPANTTDGAGAGTHISFEIDSTPGLVDATVTLENPGDADNWRFLGVIDTAGFTNVAMYSNGNWGADDFHFASAPVPEPATMLLLGTGLVGLFGFGRKKFFKK